MEKRGARPLLTLSALATFLVAGIGGVIYAALVAEPSADDPSAVTASLVGPSAAPDAKTSGPSRAAAPAAQGTDAHVRGVVRLYRTKAVVEGLELTLKRPEANPLTVTTGPDGTFRFQAVSPGVGWELTGSRAPYAPISLPMELAPSEERDVGTLWLEVPVGMTAIVYDLSGKPLKGATVDVFAVSRAGTVATSQNDNEWWWDMRAWEQRVLAVTSNPKPTKSATTDETGKAVVDGLMPGTYRVRASAAGCATATRGGVLLAPDAAPAPVRIVLGPGHELSGTVVDEKGAAVVGANVIAAEGDDWSVGLDKWAAATSDKGAFKLDGLAAGQMSIYLDRPGKPLLLVGSAGIPETTRYDIRLRPGGSIRGTVTDEQGKPVAKADVRMAMQKSWSPMAGVTDKDGKFDLADVPAGPIAYFRIDCEGYMPYPDPSAPESGSGESLREGAVMTRDVVLRRGLAAEVHVTGSDTNEAIEGCEVTLYVVKQWGDASQPWKATTDKEGLAKISGLVPGNYLVVLKAPGYVQEGLPPWYTNLLQSPDAMPAQWRLNASGDGGAIRGDYKLTRGAVVTGRVWDPNKQPVAGARVTVQGARNEFPVFSDGEGRFKMDAVAPSNRCVAEAFGADDARGASDPFIVRPGQTVENIDVRLAPCGRASGTVRTPDGKPLQGAMVRFVMGKLDENNPWGFQQFQSAERFPVGPDGRFSIPAIPAGNATVRADAEGYLPAWKNDVVIIANQETGGVELILRNALEISGRVEAQSGGTVAGAQIYAQYTGVGEKRSWGGFVTGLSGEPSAQTDAEGKFTLKSMQEGNYTIWAQAPGFASGTRVNTKTGAGDVIIRLAPGKKISGVVKDEAQSPIGGVPVRAQKTDNRNQGEWWWWGNAQVYTAPDGTFEMSDLADTAYDLTVSAMWQWGREVNVEDTKLQGVNAGRDDVVITVKTGSVIEGRIVDRDEKPIRVAWISAQFESGDQQNQDWSSQRWAQTRPDGTFRVVGLKPGSYTIWAWGDFKAASLKGVGSGTKDAKIIVEPGFSIWGRIVDVEGLALAGECNFQVRKAGEENWNWSNVVQPGDGNFVVLSLDQGRYDLMVTADGYAPVVVPNVTAGDRELTVTVQKGLDMAGTVADATGSAAANANVWAIQLNPAAGAQAAQSQAQTDDKGNFRMVGLAPGEYRVIVRAANLAPAILPSVAAGSTSVRAVLEVGVSVSGSVADEAGAAFTGYNGQLQLLLNDVGLCSAQINQKDGTFEFRNVPSNQKWKLMGWAWSQNGQYQLTHEGEIESGATEVKVVAKPNR
jgi:protocatechuate 3,4-dioxygenase beta subunit